MSKQIFSVVSEGAAQATAVVELSPRRAVQVDQREMILSGVVTAEGPVPVAAIIRQVLQRYGLTPEGSEAAAVTPRAETPAHPRTGRECPERAARWD
ncbi:MAG TPA: hypothetical protein VFV87_08230 [Pirellulaceae bacterium]|nr:hypothetical protein [Pirellulaceae bacterium]